MIHRFDYADRSFLRSKRCNASISMRAVMNSGRYLGITILQSSGVIWVVIRRSKHANHTFMGLRISAPTKIVQAGVNTPPSKKESEGNGDLKL